ncbi:MAG: hypothetical protein F6K42_20780, partial [Leptolyngbya sp. SIO1D8]|nr:hypothetical protein [Leptolyngbya sp. SIO1D8]
RLPTVLRRALDEAELKNQRQVAISQLEQQAWRESILNHIVQTRPGPTDNESILGLIGPDSFIEPIAFDGDWMQVRVTQPTNGCEFLPGSRTQEGWMRWRDLEHQSLVWYPPKGC